MFKAKKQMYYKNRIYSSAGNKILVRELGVSKDRPYLTIQGLTPFNHLDLYNRVFRHGIHNFYKISDSIDCVVTKRKILFYEQGELLNTLLLEHGSRPLRQGIVYGSDYIIYSEYHGNKERDPIHVYKYNFMVDERSILVTFNNVRHIHCIQRSTRNPNVLLIGSGDLDRECAIYQYDLSSRGLSRLGGGSQMWRAVSILETDEALIWGTDDPVNQNHIIRFDRGTAKVERLRKIAGPAYYSALTKDKVLFLATTVEDRKTHRAIIYKSKDGANWEIFREFKKDLFDSRFFGYGIVEFINNQEDLKEPMYHLNGLRHEC